MAEKLRKPQRFSNTCRNSTQSDKWRSSRIVIRCTFPAIAQKRISLRRKRLLLSSTVTGHVELNTLINCILRNNNFILKIASGSADVAMPYKKNLCSSLHPTPRILLELTIIKYGKTSIEILCFSSQMTMSASVVQ